MEGFGLVLITFLIYFHSRPLLPPKVSGHVPVTHNGSQKNLVGTDGARLYFNEYASACMGIAQVSGSGGEVASVPVPASMSLLAVSPDGAALLVAPELNNRTVVGANEVGALVFASLVVGYVGWRHIGVRGCTGPFRSRDMVSLCLVSLQDGASGAQFDWRFALIATG